MTADLVAFLRARLDEREAAAVAAGGVSANWSALGTGVYPAATVDDDVPPLVTTGPEVGGSDEDAARAEHIARQDPARALREVEAQRQIMDCHESWVAGNGDIICGRCGREHIDGRPGGHFPCQTLRLLALPDADHPDYLPEWRP